MKFERVIQKTALLHVIARVARVDSRHEPASHTAAQLGNDSRPILAVFTVNGCLGALV